MKRKLIIALAAMMAMSANAEIKREDYPSYKAYLDAVSASNAKHAGIREKREAEYAANWEEEIFNIDQLQIKRVSSRGDQHCASGGRHKFIVTGVIGPDSTFAMERLLERHQPCIDSAGALQPVVVSFKSGGGFLSHGYALGIKLRELGITTIIEDGATCASSCAVAFLGGQRRVVSKSGSILFHAPYFEGRNEYGERDISCDIGEESLEELRFYYQVMTDEQTGDRLFDRTMWYCSADDGWVVTGSSAAELFGIATQKSAEAGSVPDEPVEDDVVAQHLRSAAEREPDPVVRERLWQEYEEYKRR